MAKVNWVKGSIPPPEDGEYYVIAESRRNLEAIKNGQCKICSDVFANCRWISHDDGWNILGWAGMLKPDIPEGIRDRVAMYFGTSLEKE